MGGEAPKVLAWGGRTVRRGIVVGVFAGAVHRCRRRSRRH